MAMTDWVVRLRSHGAGEEGRILESANFRNPDAAMEAYRALLARDELEGEPLTAVFKPPNGLVTDGNQSTWYSRFDLPVGKGRVAATDSRLDPMATPERVSQVQNSLPKGVRLKPTDWENDERPFADVLKAWHARAGLTRDEAAAALCVPRSTYDGWCAGRGTAVERMARKLMTMIDAEVEMTRRRWAGEEET